MKTRRINNEVLYADEDIVSIGRMNIMELKTLFENNIRKRIRLCVHQDEKNMLHEMIIILGKGDYIRPHRHPGKSESFHVIEGSADIILFNESGTPMKRISLGDFLSGNKFFFRIDLPIFHSLVVESDFFIFHETTKGPFNRSDTEFAPWSPEETDVNGGNLFLCNVLQRTEVSI